MRKYILYLALPSMICLFSSCLNDPSKKQKTKESTDVALEVDSIQKQIIEADAELKSFLKEN